MINILMQMEDQSLLALTIQSDDEEKSLNLSLKSIFSFRINSSDPIKHILIVQYRDSDSVLAIDANNTFFHYYFNGTARIQRHIIDDPIIQVFKKYPHNGFLTKHRVYFVNINNFQIITPLCEKIDRGIKSVYLETQHSQSLIVYTDSHEVYTVNVKH